MGLPSVPIDLSAGSEAGLTRMLVLFLVEPAGATGELRQSGGDRQGRNSLHT